MKRRCAWLAALLLSACAGNGRSTPLPDIYDFGQPAARLSADDAWSRLALEIKAPTWFDSPGIAYRLAYEDPLKLRDYTGSRWAGAPAQLLGQRLRQQLGVAGATGNVAVDCLLRFDLQEFSQVFDAPQQSRGVLHGSLSVLDGKRRVVAERAVAVEQAAPAADARGGVVALVAASDELGRQIGDWLRGLDRSGGLKMCRPTGTTSSKP